ncbi:glycine dehydrogenase [Basidiobolus meristosporus CBS 931.73]|uniref:Glycine cleavage system H protein n=1 Tax=Basidiobolus meristosporus CBS 931.73 TaxID=1314790 RepID=A0A1Y1Z5E6_9FUNG|nr:glycine dehydrogenase [Basidiobolus meristosporus CBS 931.73]|eukprot:ORY05436.1 glycine dehydrogenase [Basidiobolus meristosporus CBS 931.73]
MSLRVFSSSLLRNYTTSLRASVNRAAYYSTIKKYTEDHEWVSVTDGVGTVGITDYAQKALGDVVFVEIPETGATVETMAQIGAVESVKAASDIFAPLAGEIVESNSALESEPSLINSSPEENGWLCKIKLADVSQIDTLMDEEAYKAHCEH